MTKKAYHRAIAEDMTKVSLFSILSITIIEEKLLAVVLFPIILLLGGFVAFIKLYRK